MKLKQEIWSLVILIEVDETYTMVWLSRSPKVKVKLTRPLKMRKWRFSNSISSAISQAILNLIVAYESMGQYLNFDQADFRYSLSCHVTSKLAKNAKMTIFKIYRKLFVFSFFFFSGLKDPSPVCLNFWNLRNWRWSSSGLTSVGTIACTFTATPVCHFVRRRWM